jgi:hypothetical protein
VVAAPVCRGYREGDEVSINRAFARESGVKRSLDEWSWLYPAEETGRTIVVAEVDGDVVAHCGGVPLRLAVDDNEWHGVRVADFFGPSRSTAGSSLADLVEEVAEDFVQTVASRKGSQFLLGFSTRRDAESDAFPRSLGVPAPTQFHAYTRQHAALAPPRRLFYRAEVARDWEPRLDELWARVRGHYPVAVVRDADRALRRFVGHPTVRYQRFLVFPRFSGTAVGFGCFRCDEGRLRWVDLLWDHRHPGALELLAHISACLVRQFDVAGEELQIVGDEVTRVRLEALGFRRSADPAELSVVIRSFDPGFDAAKLPSRLYLTVADTEMV